MKNRGPTFSKEKVKEITPKSGRPWTVRFSSSDVGSGGHDHQNRRSENCPKLAGCHYDDRPRGHGSASTQGGWGWGGKKSNALYRQERPPSPRARNWNRRIDPPLLDASTIEWKKGGDCLEIREKSY